MNVKVLFQNVSAQVDMINFIVANLTAVQMIKMLHPFTESGRSFSPRSDVSTWSVSEAI